MISSVAVSHTYSHYFLLQGDNLVWFDSLSCSDTDCSIDADGLDPCSDYEVEVFDDDSGGTAGLGSFTTEAAGRWWQQVLKRQCKNAIQVSPIQRTYFNLKMMNSPFSEPSGVQALEATTIFPDSIEISFEDPADNYPCVLSYVVCWDDQVISKTTIFMFAKGWICSKIYNIIQRNVLCNSLLKSNILFQGCAQDFYLQGA